MRRSRTARSHVNRSAFAGFRFPPEVIAVNSVAGVELPDGRVLLASGGRDSAVRRWDAATGAPVGAGDRAHRLTAAFAELALDM